MERHSGLQGVLGFCFKARTLPEGIAKLYHSILPEGAGLARAHLALSRPCSTVMGSCCCGRKLLQKAQRSRGVALFFTVVKYT